MFDADLGTFEVGNVIGCSFPFLDSNGNLVDPAQVFFEFKPAGASWTGYQYGVDAELIRDSQGNYHVDVFIDPQFPGKCLVRVYSLSNYIARKTKFFLAVGGPSPNG